MTHYNCDNQSTKVKEIVRPGMRIKIYYDPQSHYYTVHGRIHGHRHFNYIAPQHMPLGYSPSKGALPFPNRLVAYQNTVNQGTVKANGEGWFIIKLYAPGAYYTHHGRKLVLPELVLTASPEHMWIIPLTDIWYHNHLSTHRHTSR